MPGAGIAVYARCTRPPPCCVTGLPAPVSARVRAQVAQHCICGTFGADCRSTTSIADQSASRGTRVREDPFRWHPNKSVRKIRNGSKTSNQAGIRAFLEIYQRWYSTEFSGRHASASVGSGGQPADELRHVEYLGWYCSANGLLHDIKSWVRSPAL